MNKTQLIDQKVKNNSASFSIEKSVIMTELLKKILPTFAKYIEAKFEYKEKNLL
jgi:hypothetical protein